MPPKYKVICPGCKRKQHFVPHKLRFTEFGKPILRGKSKTCIQCGKKFLIYKNAKDHRILKFDVEMRKV